MQDLGKRARANIDVVLDEVCSVLPHGGDHESRKFVAESLVARAKAGNASLGELAYAGRRALTQLKRRATGSAA